MAPGSGRRAAPDPALLALLGSLLLTLAAGQGVIMGEVDTDAPANMTMADDAAGGAKMNGTAPAEGNATQCPKTHPWVGLEATFEDMVDKNISGTVVVQDDCSFLVKGFSYDGTGPDTILLGANTAEELAQGFVFRPLPSGQNWDGGEDLEHTLEEGTTWDDISIISVWCREFVLDFGSADLKKATIPEGIGEEMMEGEEMDGETTDDDSMDGDMMPAGNDTDR